MSGGTEGQSLSTSSLHEWLNGGSTFIGCKSKPSVKAYPPHRCESCETDCDLPGAQCFGLEGSSDLIWPNLCYVPTVPKRMLGRLPTHSLRGACCSEKQGKRCNDCRCEGFGKDHGDPASMRASLKQFQLHNRTRSVRCKLFVATNSFSGKIFDIIQAIP